MPIWKPLDIEPVRYSGESDVFAKSRAGFPAASRGKDALATAGARQRHFEEQLLRVVEALESERVPLVGSFGGERRRMDRGCVGRAVARGFIEPRMDGPAGVVTEVVLHGRTGAGV